MGLIILTGMSYVKLFNIIVQKLSEKIMKIFLLNEPFHKVGHGKSVISTLKFRQKSARTLVQPNFVEVPAS